MIVDSPAPRSTTCESNSLDLLRQHFDLPGTPIRYDLR